MNNVDKKLNSLGIKLTEVPKPIGAYIPCRKTGNLIFVSGQLPKKNGKLITGKLGLNLSVEQGKHACEIAFINALSIIKNEISDLDNIDYIVRMAGYINSDNSFTEQATVMNAVSELAYEILGEKGRHARLALGTNSLPLDACCELELIVKIKD